MATPSNANLIAGVNKLDFEEIKANLIEFLRVNNDFPDAVYAGSAFNTLLDVLAYNTHYAMLYSSFTLNEAFLDSCSKYSSAVSIAKSMGYVPYSTTAAKISIDKVVATESTILPKGTTFSASMGGVPYQFTTIDSIPLITQDDQYNTRFKSGPFEIYCGTLATETVTIRTVPGAKKFYNTRALISNRGCDISTLRVSIINPVTGEQESWSPAQNFPSIGPNDRVFFLRMREDLFYEVYFGDGIIGASPAIIGNTQDYIDVVLEYVTIPDAFVQPDNISPSTVVVKSGADLSLAYITYVNPISPFQRGSSIEPIESIKYNAPRSYVAQNRAVTKSDYQALVSQKFPWIESVRVWGGEDHTPPRYGSVYLSVKPIGRDFTSNSEKNQIVTFLKNSKSMLTIVPFVVDPSYTRLKVNTTITLDGSKVAADLGDVKSKITTVVSSYINSLYLNSDASFRISELSSLIDGATPGILSNDTDVSLEQELPVFIGISGNYKIRLDNTISREDNSVYSSRFKVQGSDKWNIIKSTTAGDLLLCTMDEDGQIISAVDIGKVEFVKGQISLRAITITDVESQSGASVTWSIKPARRDIRPIRDMILKADPEDIITKFTVEKSTLQNRGY